MVQNSILATLAQRMTLNAIYSAQMCPAVRSIVAQALMRQKRCTHWVGCGKKIRLTFETSMPCRSLAFTILSIKKSWTPICKYWSAFSPGFVDRYSVRSNSHGGSVQCVHIESDNGIKARRCFRIYDLQWHFTKWFRWSQNDFRR